MQERNNVDRENKNRSTAASKDVSEEIKLQNGVNSIELGKYIERLKNNDLKLGEILRWDVDISDIRALAPYWQNCPDFTLNLSGNIEAERIAALGPYLSQCPNLTKLYVHKNDKGVESIAAIAPFLPNLVDIFLNSSICDERIKVLAPVLLNFPSLRRLALRGNEIGDDGVAALAPYLPKCLNLNELDLMSNKIGDEGIAALAPYLPNCPNLNELNLLANKIGDEGIIALAPYLPKCPNLKILNLGGNKIGDKSIAVLAPHLPNCPNLTELYLHNNEIGDEGINALAPFLPNFPNLTRLEVGNNKIGDEGINALAPYLIILSFLSRKFIFTFDYNTYNKKIEKVSRIRMFDRWRSSNEVARKTTSLQNGHVLFDIRNHHNLDLNEISKILNNFPFIKSLNAQCKNFSLEDLKVLGPALKNIQVLDLSDNALNHIERNPNGMKTIAPYLTNVVELNLSANQLADRGMKDLTLTKGSTIQSLDISYNHISIKGLEKLATFLKENPLITKLNLANNKLEGGSFDSIHALSEFFKTLTETQVTELDLSGNELGDDGIKALITYIKDSRITMLKLNRCGFTHVGLLLLAQHLDPSITLELNGNSINEATITANEDISRNKSISNMLLQMRFKKAIAYLAKNDLEHLRELFARSPDLCNARDHKERTLLHYINNLTDHSIINFLLENKIDVLARDAAGNTALHYVVQHGYMNAVLRLMQLMRARGIACLELRNNAQETVLDVATAHHHPAIREYFNNLHAIASIEKEQEQCQNKIDTIALEIEEAKKCKSLLEANIATLSEHEDKQTTPNGEQLLRKENEKLQQVTDKIKELQTELDRMGRAIAATVERQAETIKTELKEQLQHMAEDSSKLNDAQLRVEKAIEKLQQEFDLRQKSDEEYKEELQTLQEELSDINQNLAAINQEREVLAARKSNIESFECDPNLRDFYRAVQRSLERLFISCYAASGGQVGVARGNFDLPMQGLELFSDICNVVPLAGPLVLFVAKWSVGKAMQKIDEEQQTQKADSIARLLTLSELKLVSENVAVRLTNWYAPVLAKLLTSTDERTRGFTKKSNEKYKSSATKAAEYALVWFLDSLDELQSQEGTALEETIVDIITTKKLTKRESKGFLGRTFAKLAEKLDKKKIKMAIKNEQGELIKVENKKLAHLFSACGIQVHKGDGLIEFYGTEGTSIFGYCNGTIAAAVTRGLGYRHTSVKPQLNRDTYYYAPKEEAKPTVNVATEVESVNTAEPLPKNDNTAEEKREEPVAKGDNTIAEKKLEKKPVAKKRLQQNNTGNTIMPSARHNMENLNKKVKEAESIVDVLKKEVKKKDDRIIALETASKKLEIASKEKDEKIAALEADANKKDEKIATLESKYDKLEQLVQLLLAGQQLAVQQSVPTLPSVSQSLHTTFSKKPTDEKANGTENDHALKH